MSEAGSPLAGEENIEGVYSGSATLFQPLCSVGEATVAAQLIPWRSQELRIYSFSRLIFEVSDRKVARQVER